jgi:hypothetical protein
MNIFVIATIVALIWHPLAIILNIKDYDSSTDLIDIDPLLKHAFRWDSLFFYENAHNGYRFEKNHAFFPGNSFIPRVLKAFN